jgi:hypothetical protein
MSLGQGAGRSQTTLSTAREISSTSATSLLMLLSYSLLGIGTYMLLTLQTSTFHLDYAFRELLDTHFC